VDSYGIHEVLAIKSHQIHWNHGIHEDLAIKSHQIQWKQSNLIKPNGISWDPSDFSNQIPSNPMESYGAMGF
jgi:hypothetical protein